MYFPKASVHFDGKLKETLEKNNYKFPKLDIYPPEDPSILMILFVILSGLARGYEIIQEVFFKGNQYVELWELLLLPFSMFLMYFVMFALFKLPLCFIQVFTYLSALFLSFLIYIANLIHPTKRVLGGIGIIIAFIGLLIDAYQAISPLSL